MATAKKTRAKPPADNGDTIVAEKPSTALVSYKDRMAQLVAQTKKAEAPTGGFLSTKGGRLSNGTTALPGDKIVAIIIDYKMDNEFFPEAYVAGKSQFATCHAIVNPTEFQSPWRKPRDGENTLGLVTDKASGMVADCSKPEVKPGEGCSDCRMSQWESVGLVKGKQPGRGKACRESRRLAILAADQCTTPADIARAPHMTLIPPPTSLDNFKTYANEVSMLDVPIFGAVVEISVKPHEQWQFTVNYKMLEAIRDPGILMALLQRHEQISAKQISMPKPNSSPAEKDARGSKF